MLGRRSEVWDVVEEVTCWTNGSLDTFWNDSVVTVVVIVSSATVVETSSVVEENDSSNSSG